MSRASAALEKLVDASEVSTARAHPLGAELPLAAPHTLEGLVEVVRCAARERWTVVPIGLGSKLGWTRAIERADLLLSTRNYAGIVSHVPDDGTLSARAGSRIDELRERARAGGHWLTPELAPRANATLGGTLAAGVSGLDRVRFGPVRNHVLGMKVVLADGTIAKSGGQLVKNVTGYDLHRLYTGSLGGLCLIVEAALRLFPAPESEAFFELPTATLADAFALVRRAEALEVRWLWLAVARGKDGDCRVVARVAGKRDTVAWEIAAVERVLDGATRADDDAAKRAAAAFQDRLPNSHATPHARLTTRASKLLAALDEASSALERVGVRPSIVAQPTIGEATLEFSPESSLAAARALRANSSANLELRHCAREVEPFAAPGPELALMRRLRDALDPQGVFARGRFVDGL